jgi:hypothetical protein
LIEKFLPVDVVIVITLGINMLVAVLGYYLIIAWGCSVAHQPALGVHLEKAKDRHWGRRKIARDR